jgi:hypothetical protein
MKIHTFLRATLLALLLSTTNYQSSAFAQGNIAPATAPSVPIMKTLQQIEPRIDLKVLYDQNHDAVSDDANYEIVITEPGSYYLSSNMGPAPSPAAMPVTRSNAIKISAAGVTLDLNGFEISRSSGTGGTGISVLAIRCAIRNGTITGFGSGIGASLVGNSSSSISHVSVAGCSGYGIGVGNGWLIESCGASSNKTGISGGLGCTIRDCTATSNGLTGFFDYGIFAAPNSTIESSSVYQQNGGFGIYAQSGCTIANCTVGSGTMNAGIYGDSGSTITRCTVNDVTSAVANSGGILLNGAGNITGCTVRNAQNTNGTPGGVTGYGIAVNNTGVVKACTAQGNKGDGIRGINNCLITENLCTDNGSGTNCGGIHVTGSGNRIESNNLVGNNANGVLVDAGGNLIIKNSSRGGSAAFTIATGNSKGEEINVYNAAATTTITSSNSWANFLY